MKKYKVSKMKKYKVSLKIADTSEPEVRIFDTQDEATDWAGGDYLRENRHHPRA